MKDIYTPSFKRLKKQYFICAEKLFNNWKHIKVTLPTSQFTYGSKLTMYSRNAGGSGNLLAVTAGFIPIE